jgi:8-oxo-dGTP diphosphatase
VSEQGISAAIIVHEDRVLMIRRRVSEGELSWAFPAGGIEAGESAEQAAVRETAEETSLTVEAVKLLGQRIHPKTGRSMSYVACRMVGGVAVVNDVEELAEICWATHGQLPELVPYGLFPVVQQYLDAELA